MKKKKFVPFLERLTEKQHKKFLVGVNELREKFQIKMKNKKVTAKTQFPPRYDEVYYDGIKWLNSL
jgi:hypothetical protein